MDEEVSLPDFDQKSDHFIIFLLVFVYPGTGSNEHASEHNVVKHYDFCSESASSLEEKSRDYPVGQREHKPWNEGYLYFWWVSKVANTYTNEDNCFERYDRFQVTDHV